jgi:hypothetical protein
VELAVTSAEELPAGEPVLFEGRDREGAVRVSEDFRALLDRFAARLGAGAFGWIELCQDYRPVKSFALSRTPPAAPAAPWNAPRPTRCFAPPRPAAAEFDAEGFPVRVLAEGAWRRVVRVLGPEKVNTAWWDRPRRGESFVAERDDGVCLWLFRDAATGEAFVEGVFH